MRVELWRGQFLQTQFGVGNQLDSLWNKHPLHRRRILQDPIVRTLKDGSGISGRSTAENNITHSKHIQGGMNADVSRGSNDGFGGGLHYHGVTCLRRGGIG